MGLFSTVRDASPHGNLKTLLFLNLTDDTVPLRDEEAHKAVRLHSQSGNVIKLKKDNRINSLSSNQVLNALVV